MVYEGPEGGPGAEATFSTVVASHCDRRWEDREGARADDSKPNALHFRVKLPTSEKGEDAAEQRVQSPIPSPATVVSATAAKQQN